MINLRIEGYDRGSSQILLRLPTPCLPTQNIEVEWAKEQKNLFNQRQGKTRQQNAAGPDQLMERKEVRAIRRTMPQRYDGWPCMENDIATYVSNCLTCLKKYLAGYKSACALEEINVDKTLCFVEEPVEIIDREVKSLKRSRIPIVKSIGTRSEVMRIL
ncbi:hypothetical protein Tco_0716011 [Tanacetum coccineum]